MNKKRLPAKAVLSQEQTAELRDALLRQFFNMSNGAMLHIDKSLYAQIPCPHCIKVKDVWLVKVPNAEGVCSFCVGTHRVPDNAQRNWATEQIQDRILPKTKPMEVKVGELGHLKEFESELGETPVDKLNAMAAALGITFQTEDPVDGRDLATDK